MIKPSLFAAGIALLATISARGEDLILTDIDGQTHQPWSEPSTKAVVLVFIATDCPIANSYQPELRRLQAEYEKLGFSFFQVYPDPDPDLAAIREHAKEYDVKSPIVLDSDQRLSRKTGASVTPEAAVLDRQGQTLYLGRIDNSYSALGKQRAVITKRDLRDALEDIKAGRAVESRRVKALGCPIPKP